MGVVNPLLSVWSGLLLTFQLYKSKFVDFDREEFRKKYQYEWWYRVFLKSPYDLWMTYWGVFDSYIDQHVVYYKQKPDMLWYPYFFFATFGYMAYSSLHILDGKLREHYRDKSLAESVRQIDNNTIEVTYEWKKQLYHIRVPIDRMQANQLVSASAVCKEGKQHDITKLLKKYLGPVEDWHNLEYAPTHFGYKSITLSKLDPEEFEMKVQSYDENDVMHKMKHL